MLLSYPAGATVSCTILDIRTVLPAQLVTIDGITHGPEIAELWTDAELASFGIMRVVVADVPTDANGWRYLPGDPVDVVDGSVVRRTWPNAVPDTEGWAAHLEAKAQALRTERNARLTACDWTQMPDAPLTSEQRTAWAVYRQALRDVPEQEGVPLEVSWPVKPE